MIGVLERYPLLQVGVWMAGLAPHVEEEVVMGEANVQQTFPLRGANAGVVAGCRVTTGSVAAAERFRLLRGGTTVWEGSCSSLKRQKQDVHRVGKVGSLAAWPSISIVHHEKRRSRLGHFHAERTRR